MSEKFKLVKYDMRQWFDDKFESELIKEVEFEPEVGLNLEIGGQVYHICAMFPKGKIAGLEPITLEEEPEEEYNDDFICPYCKTKDQDAFELNDDEGTTECCYCGSKLEYTREYTVTYTVSPKRPNEPFKLR
jgi:hypothetical protein